MNDTINDMGMDGGEQVGVSVQPIRGSYQNPAVVGGGLQALAEIATRAGNNIELSQGHHELAPQMTRRPMHPGHNPVFDRLERAKYEGESLL
jgi:hypothetical protein